MRDRGMTDDGLGLAELWGICRMHTSFCQVVKYLLEDSDDTMLVTCHRRHPIEDPACSAAL